MTLLKLFEMFQEYNTFVFIVEHLLQMIADNEATLTTGDNILENSEVLETAPYRVRGCFLTVVERLNEEFHKVLKGCDAHSNEYVDRLKDEDRVMEILEKAQKIIEKSKTPSEMCRIYLQRIDHIYFKFDPQVIQQRNVSTFEDFFSISFKMMINYVLQFRATAMKSLDMLKSNANDKTNPRFRSTLSLILM